MVEINNTELACMHSKIKIETEEVDTKCMMCGSSILEGIKIKKILGSNFTNLDICKDLNSIYMCKYCAHSIKDDTFRKKNLLISKKDKIILTKNDLEHYIFNLEEHVEGEFIFCVTQSFKKHNVIRATVNLDPNYYKIRLEEDEFIIDVNKHKELYKRLNAMYLFFTKDELEYLQFKDISMLDYVANNSIKEFRYNVDLFKKYKGTSIYKFLIFILNSELRNVIVKERIDKQKELLKIEKAKEKERLKKEKELLKELKSKKEKEVEKCKQITMF
ncbi:MAG: hypothetical protein R3Y64_08765 [Peptostreptococcaceae bacterium]